MSKHHRIRLHRIMLSAAFAVLFCACRPSLSLAAGTASRLSVPAALQGAWYVGPSCQGVSSYFFRGDGWSVAIVGQPDGKTIVANSSLFSVLAIEPDGSMPNGSMPNGSMTVSAWWQNPGTHAYVPAKFKLTGSGSHLDGAYIAPAAAAETPHISEIRCTNPEVAGKPWPLAADYLAGLTSVLETVSGIQNACDAGTHACAEAIIGALDLVHDGKISKAELVSFFRRTAKLGLLPGKVVPGTTMARAKFTLDDVAGTALGAAVIGPIFATMAMSNIDYNGDGFIEEDELEAFLREIGIPPGHGRMGQLIASIVDSTNQAARSLGALQQLLGAFGH